MGVAPLSYGGSQAADALIFQPAEVKVKTEEAVRLEFALTVLPGGNAANDFSKGEVFEGALSCSDTSGFHR